MNQQTSKKNSQATTQLDRFKETARHLECDEDKERFEKKLGKIATAKPAQSAAQRKKPA